MEINEEIRNRIESEAYNLSLTEESGSHITADGYVVVIDVETVHLGGDGWNEPREYGTYGSLSILTPDEECEIATGEIVPDDGLLDLDWESDENINELLAEAAA